MQRQSIIILIQPDKELIARGNFKKNVYMGTHFVIFDGTSHYVVDEQDMREITRKDNDAKVVFKSMNFDIACDKADELNEEI